MTTRKLRGVFSTIALASALWALSGGVARAQVCELCPPPAPPPPEIVTCPVPGSLPCGDGCPPPDSPVTCSNNPDTPYTSSQNVKVFTFGRDNSIQVKFIAALNCPINLTVTLSPTSQLAFHNRVKTPSSCTGVNCCNNPPSPVVDDGVFPPEVTCHETVSIDLGAADDPTTFCAIYSLSADHPECISGLVSDNTRVEYLIGWKAPDKGNKHDFFLLRDPDADDPNYDSAHPQCFTQNITVGTVIGNYKPGGVNDPGLGGRACCPSDYVVARQKIRPVTPK